MNPYALLLIWILCGWLLTAIIIGIGLVVEEIFPNVFGKFLYKLSILFGGPVTWGVLYIALLE